MGEVAGLLLAHDTGKPHSEFPVWIIFVIVAVAIAAAAFFFLRNRGR